MFVLDRLYIGCVVCARFTLPVVCVRVCMHVQAHGPRTLSGREVLRVNAAVSLAQRQADIATALRENNLCSCTLSLSNSSDKRRSISDLISEIQMAKAAVWKTLHA